MSEIRCISYTIARGEIYRMASIGRGTYQHELRQTVEVLKTRMTEPRAKPAQCGYPDRRTAPAPKQGNQGH